MSRVGEAGSVRLGGYSDTRSPKVLSPNTRAATKTGTGDEANAANIYAARQLLANNGVDAEAQWKKRYSQTDMPYSMNGVYADGQISTGVGNNSTYITVHSGKEVIGFALDESGSVRELEDHELAEKKLVGPRPQNGYFFTEPRDIRQMEVSGPAISQTCPEGIIDDLATQIANPDKKVAFYSGAGISVAAGIDDINGYNRRISGTDARPNSLQDLEAIAARVKADPKAILSSVKGFFQSFYLTEPAAAHEAIAEIQQISPNDTPVFTENLDLLHQKTGVEVMPMKPAEEMKAQLNEDALRQLDTIVCTGLSHDDRGFIAYLREINPGITIVGNALPGQKPIFIDETNPNDIYLAGNAHEILPRLAQLTREKLS